MIINSHITTDAIAIAELPNRQAALEELSRLFADAYDLDYHKVLEGLEEREALGSTGFGREAAIPHARIRGLRRPSMAVLRPTEPLDFEAADAMPVRLIVGLLSPEDSGSSHLQTLAAISRMVRDEDMREALIAAPDSDAIYGLITNAVESDAA